MFEFQKLVTHLESIEYARRSLFAVMTAERLAPFFRRYASLLPDGVEVLDGGLDYVWSRISTEKLGADQREGSLILSQIEHLIPPEDSSELFSAQADDAASSLMYAIRSLYSPDPREAAWAAQRAYDTVDNFVNNLPDSTGTISKGYIDHSPLLNDELETQRADFALAQSADLTELVKLRSHSGQNGEELLGKFLSLIKRG
ncbi:DUF416 family protein [Lysobacter sp. Hz 25]|uniref:DUF416 family protein n=1 Tax=Lysobacter sp. Hz 25 TaxID=3383698 RepID=UPI0038D3562A